LEMTRHHLGKKGVQPGTTWRSEPTEVTEVSVQQNMQEREGDVRNRKDILFLRKTKKRRMDILLISGAWSEVHLRNAGVTKGEGPDHFKFQSYYSRDYSRPPGGRMTRITQPKRPGESSVISDLKGGRGGDLTNFLFRGKGSEKNFLTAVFN